MWPLQLELATSILKTNMPNHMSCVAPSIKARHFTQNTLFVLSFNYIYMFSKNF